MAEVASKRDSRASEQLRKLLQFELVDGHVHEWVKQIQSMVLTADDMVTLKMPNAVFATGSVNTEFLDTCMSTFSAEVFPLQQRHSINEFVFNNTDEMIPEILSKDPDGPAVLVNAVFFKGEWTKKFDKTFTKAGEFTPFGELPVHCRMMSMTDKKTEYKQTKHTEIIKLDYGVSQQFSAFVALPIGKDMASMDKAVQELFGSPTSWDKATDNMIQQNVKLYMPRFTVHKGVDNLKEHMQDMGVTDIFKDGGLPLMTASSDAYIGDIAHKACIKVNEDGTTAAAATAVQATRGFCHINVIKADRPFLFVVLHSTTKTILFVACVNSIGE